MNPAALLALFVTYRYGILFPLAFFEGPILALALGFLASLGYFHLWSVCLILVAGNTVPDTVFYCMGRYGSNISFIKRNIHRIGLSDDRLRSIEHLWGNHSFKSMFVAKWALGLTSPLLILAGMSRVPFRKYIAAALIIGTLNYTFLLAVGYFMSESYVVAARYVGYAGFFVAGAVVLFFLLYVFFARRMRRSLIEGRIE